MTGDGQAEAGSAEPSSGRAVRLSKGLEDALLVSDGDADAGIGHGEVDDDRFRAACVVCVERFQAETDNDSTAVGELDCIAE